MKIVHLSRSDVYKNSADKEKHFRLLTLYFPDYKQSPPGSYRLIILHDAVCTSLSLKGSGCNCCPDITVKDVYGRVAFKLEWEDQ
jgi:hypothetical protein